MIRLTLLQIAQASNFPLQMFLLTCACINWVVLIQLENKGCCRRGTINEDGEKNTSISGWWNNYLKHQQKAAIWHKSFTLPVKKSRV